jgi:hypothetical protein
MPVVSIIWLCNHTRTEFDKPYAYHETVLLGICQWCGNPYFAVAAISLDVYLQQIPSRYIDKVS